MHAYATHAQNNVNAVKVKPILNPAGSKKEQKESAVLNHAKTLGTVAQTLCRHLSWSKCWMSVWWHLVSQNQVLDEMGGEESELVEDSDEDLELEIEDEEIEEIMQYVFGAESDNEIDDHDL